MEGRSAVAQASHELHQEISAATHADRTEKNGGPSSVTGM
jgi:hypothetical protein